MWTDDTSLVTVWICSQCALSLSQHILHGRSVAFYSAVEKYHIKTAHSSPSPQKACRSEKCSACATILLSKWNDADVLCYVCPVCPCPTFCVSSGAVLQPDPECCESLFIKSIPVPWPRSSHADCCLLRPLFAFFIHMDTHTCTHAELHWDNKLKL